MVNLRRLGLTVATVLAATCAPAQARTGNSGPRSDAANLALVTSFYDRVFNRHEVARGAAVIADAYRQHNPGVPDGKAPFVDFFTGYFKEHPEARARIVHSASSGGLVWLHVHSTEGPHDRGQAVIDIFRVRGGKIVEHWDVVQDVPEKSANANSMF